MPEVTALGQLRELREEMAARKIDIENKLKEQIVLEAKRRNGSKIAELIKTHLILDSELDINYTDTPHYKLKFNYSSDTLSAEEEAAKALDDIDNRLNSDTPSAAEKEAAKALDDIDNRLNWDNPIIPFSTEMNELRRKH